MFFEINCLSLLISYVLHNFFLLCSQSLINLLLTGHAVSNVWDGDRECSGMSKLILVYACSYFLHTLNADL